MTVDLDAEEHATLLDMVRSKAIEFDENLRHTNPASIFWPAYEHAARKFKTLLAKLEGK